jgi:Tfp pilus assembly protein PilX
VSGDRGFVLVTVLLLTLATWALLAAMLTTSFLHYRLALGAERGAVAAAAAERAVADYLNAAVEARDRDGSWPTPGAPQAVAGCILELIEAAEDDGWWRVRVRGSFEGTQAWREGTVHAAP